jgi:hypothetical protein
VARPASVISVAERLTVASDRLEPRRTRPASVIRVLSNVTLQRRHLGDRSQTFVANARFSQREGFEFRELLEIGESRARNFRSVKSQVSQFQRPDLSLLWFF